MSPGDAEIKHDVKDLTEIRLSCLGGAVCCTLEKNAEA
jgi:hypothetical protein